jgi:hypothetical protein
MAKQLRALSYFYVKTLWFSAHQLHVALQEKQLHVNDGYKSE